MGNFLINKQMTQIKCDHQYNMNGDMGLIKICNKCGKYLIITTKTKKDDKTK